MHCLRLTVFGGHEIRVRSKIFRLTLLRRATLKRNLQARSVSYRLGLFVVGFRLRWTKSGKIFGYLASGREFLKFYAPTTVTKCYNSKNFKYLWLDLEQILETGGYLYE